MPEDPQALAQRAAAAMYAADLASRHLGIQIEDVTPGRATARMLVRDTMINGHDICHGGYVFLLADTAFAFACNTYDQRTVAQHCAVTFLAPARLGDALTAHAVEVARASGAERTYLMADPNGTAKDLYERLGFRPVAQIASWIHPGRDTSPGT